MPANRSFTAGWIVLCAALLSACAGSGRVADVESRPQIPPVQTPAPRPPEARTPEVRVPETRPAPVPAPTSPSAKRPGGYYKDDGPGDNPPADMASIPDAQPRAEPLHRFANRPYAALGQNYTPRQELAPYKERGVASWYGRRFNGARTSSGEPYDMYAMTGAHPTLPIPSYVRVTNVENGKSVVVRINDRGPFHKDRVIDLSYTAAWKLGYAARGSAQVEVEAIVPEGVTVLPPVQAAASPSVPQQPTAQPEAAGVVAQQGDAAVSLPAAPATQTAVPLAPGTYLQLGAFASRRNADSFRDYVSQELKGLKESLFVVEDGERFRLHLGPYPSGDAARSMADRIAGKLKFKPFIVQR